jgi:diadenosine tetraphosphate (Ap4A) HIT family hydrolase
VLGYNSSIRPNMTEGGDNDPKAGLPHVPSPSHSTKGLEHPRKIADLEVSTAVLRENSQYYRGYTILFLRHHAVELWDLDPETRQKFMGEANQVAQALAKTFKPLKMNYALLGNTNPTTDYLHWHLRPRRLTDPNPKRPIWDENFPAPEIQLGDEEFRQLANDIRANL